jgi:circadian clock protein KaiB
MTKNSISDSTAAFEQALVTTNQHHYTLRLYTAGTSPKSLQAIANVRKICEENLHGRYELQIIDLYQQPQLAQGEQIIAAPTLIKKLPLPLRRVIDLRKQ